MEVSQWMVDSFPIIRIVLIILIVVCSVVMIGCILMQPASQQGMGAISGETDTYFSKNKEKTLQGAMKRLTIILAVANSVMAIAFFITIIGYNGVIS